MTFGVKQGTTTLSTVCLCCMLNEYLPIFVKSNPGDIARVNRGTWQLLIVTKSDSPHFVSLFQLHYFIYIKLD